MAMWVLCTVAAENVAPIILSNRITKMTSRRERVAKISPYICCHFYDVRVCDGPNIFKTYMHMLHLVFDKPKWVQLLEYAYCCHFDTMSNRSFGNLK
jgi:hypothetical protein